MKITVINGTEKHGVTWKLKEIFLDELRDANGAIPINLEAGAPNAGFCSIIVLLWNF